MKRIEAKYPATIYVPQTISDQFDHPQKMLADMLGAASRSLDRRMEEWHIFYPSEMRMGGSDPSGRLLGDIRQVDTIATTQDGITVMYSRLYDKSDGLHDRLHWSEALKHMSIYLHSMTTPVDDLKAELEGLIMQACQERAEKFAKAAEIQSAT